MISTFPWADLAHHFFNAKTQRMKTPCACVSSRLPACLQVDAGETPEVRGPRLSGGRQLHTASMQNKALQHGTRESA